MLMQYVLRMDFKILLLILALGISCGCKCSGGVRTTDIYPHESGIDSVALQKINLRRQQQPESEVDVWKKHKIICGLCKKIAAPVLKFLSNSSNQEKIKSVVDHICSVLPGDLKDKCNNEVASFYPSFIEQVAIWTPTTFCIDIQLCEDIPIPPSDLSEDISDTSNDLIKEVLLKMKDPNVQLKTIEVLLKGCDVLKDSEGLPEKCKTLVSGFAPLILDNAEQFLSPK